MGHEFIIPSELKHSDWVDELFDAWLGLHAVVAKCPYCGGASDTKNFLDSRHWWISIGCDCFKKKEIVLQFNNSVTILDFHNDHKLVGANYRLTCVDRNSPEAQEKAEEVFRRRKCQKRFLKDARFTSRGTVILSETDEEVINGIKPGYSIELEFPVDTTRKLMDYVRGNTPGRNYHHEDYTLPDDSLAMSEKSAEPEPQSEPESQNQPADEQREQIQPADTLETVSQKKPTEEKQIQKGGAVMSNQFDFTMHPLEDPNVASTVLGITVKVGDSWRVYDKAKEEITDLGNVQFGNFPIWVIPAFKLAPGDIIIDGGKYYCVTSKNKRLQTVDIGTGKSHSVVPIKNILGFSVYQKVMALTDVIGLDDMGVADDKMLLLLAMMGGAAGGDADGNAMNQMSGMLPLLLLKDMGSESKGGDSKLLLLAMMGGMNGMGDQNGLMQLLMMKQLMGDGLLGSDAASAK